MALVALLASGASCASFEDASDVAAMVQRNGCQTDNDCGDGARCRDSICVARSSSEQDVILRITPAFQTDGTEPLPVEAALPRLDSTTTRELVLPSPAQVEVRVDRDGEPVPAMVRIQLADQLPGIATRQLVASSDPQAGEVNVVLHEGQRYRARVEPMDDSLPSLIEEFEAAAGMSVRFTYPSELEVRRYRIVGGSDRPTLVVRAVHPDTRRALSSTGETDPDGRVTLAFADFEADYRLELAPNADSSASFAAQAADETGGGCGDGNASPSYSLLSTDLPAASEGDDEIRIELPAALTPVRYEGTVALCGQREDDGTALMPDNDTGLGVTLRSQMLRVDTEASETAVVASYAAETSATFDPSSGHYKFCAAVLPGVYDVIVNPPAITGSCRPEDDVATCGCGIFAERRDIDSPADGQDRAPVELTLPTMASISGGLTTEGMSPVTGATIDARARATTQRISLADSDRGVPNYNRSNQATSDLDGHFRLPLDVGAYDVTIKPPAESGFAWLVVRDVRIANRSAEFSTTFTMGAPVSVVGSLRFDDAEEAAQASLAGAVLRAYSVIQEDPDLGGQRAVQIGQATADESGQFMLLLSPSQRDGWL